MSSAQASAGADAGPCRGPMTAGRPRPGRDDLQYANSRNTGSMLPLHAPWNSSSLRSAGGLAGFDELHQRFQEARLVGAVAVEAGAPRAGRARRSSALSRQVAHGALPVAERAGSLNACRGTPSRSALRSAMVKSLAPGPTPHRARCRRTAGRPRTPAARTGGSTGRRSAPRISRYFFSRTSGNAVVMWSAQSRSVGSCARVAPAARLR